MRKTRSCGAKRKCPASGKLSGARKGLSNAQSTSNRPSAQPAPTPHVIAAGDRPSDRPAHGVDSVSLEINAPTAPAPDAIVPDSEYDVFGKCARAETFRFDGKPVTRLVVTYEIRGGPYDGEELKLVLPMPPRSNGRFIQQPSSGSVYYRAWVVANYGHRPLRGQVMTFDIFERGLFRIRSRTVTTDKRQRPLPLCNHYSVVDAILARLA